LQEAYAQAGGKAKAQETKIRYHLDLRGSNYVPYPDIEIESEWRNMLLSLVDHRTIVCLIMLILAIVFSYKSY
jgi:hypothetical protein